MWTLKGQIQQFIDVYVSQATYTEVVRSFPYMVSKEFASGGGDVREPQQPGHQAPYPSRSQIPEFKWHVFEDKVPIDVADSGILITPFEGGTVYYLTGFRLLRFLLRMQCNMGAYGQQVHRLGLFRHHPHYHRRPRGL